MSISSIEALLLSATVLALLCTKALDAYSTYRFIGVSKECNPLAKWLFERFGLVGGISIVCIIYLVILFAEIRAVIDHGSPLLTYGTVVIGLMIAYVQYDVARFNSTFQHSTITRALLRFFCGLRFR